MTRANWFNVLSQVEYFPDERKCDGCRSSYFEDLAQCILMSVAASPALLVTENPLAAELLYEKILCINNIKYIY